MSWHLQASIINPWFIFSALCALAMAYILVRRKTKYVLYFLRLSAVGLLLIAIAKPELVRNFVQRRPLLAILVDNSASMCIAKRLDDALSQLKRLMPDLQANYTLLLYSFAGNSQKVSGLKEIAGSENKESTDIARALLDVSRENPEGVCGALLVSDGNNTDGQISVDAINSLKAPVICIAPAIGRKVLDLSIVAVNAPDFAFKGAPLEVRVHYAAAGAAGKSTAVSIFGDNMRIAQRQVSFSSNSQSGDVTLSIIPQTRGMQKYVASISPIKGEISADNNNYAFSINVMRDKVRVLYICGRPSYEYSFLRHVLKNDPLIELVSFVILRNPENMTLVPENDLALIPFPVHQLFTGDLNTFDVVIFENFTYQRFGFIPLYLQNLATFVREKGGGFIMMGGENSFSGGAWRGTDVDGILPAMDDADLSGWQGGLFRAHVINIDHPIMQIADDPKRTLYTFEQLPELEGCTRLTARKGSQVLFTNPSGNWPELVVWDCGRGRCACLGVNTTWRWALQMPTADAYTNFWHNTIRWLAKANDNENQKSKPGVAAVSEIIINQGFEAHPSSITEETTLTVNEQELKRIAAETKGGYFNAENVTISDIKALTKPMAAKIVDERKSLWDTPWLLFLACGLLFFEWYNKR